MPVWPSLTKTWHNKAYSSIDPTRPELSAKGKTIVITGGGGSIGGAIALAFAQAGATQIALIGRRETPLLETKQKVERKVANVKILSVPGGDIANSKAIEDAFAKVHAAFGKIDILVANAAYLPKFASIATADPDEWWTGYESNARGSFNTARAFLKYANPAGATVVDISSGVIHIPPIATGSGYIASKTASTKIWEIFNAEQDNIDVFHLHPGVVESEINLKSGVEASDDADLPGSFTVWLVSPEASFLKGKYTWCNWDVDELLERKEEFSQPGALTILLNGWPFGRSDANGFSSP